MSRLIAAAVLSLCAVCATAQQVDLVAAEQELLHVFDRPAGVTIGDEQKARLADFLTRHAAVDLRHLGYAKSLQLYLQRDYDGAVAALDEFFDRQPEIRDAGHRTMAGRIYLNAVSRAARSERPDTAQLARWGERMTRLYDDTAMLERMALAILPRVPDPAAMRVALARGVFASALSDAAKDGFLQRLYAGAADPGPAPARPSVGEAVAVGYRPGDLVEPFAVDEVLNGSFDLLQLRGKVVVLDFFATWCPPCRAAVPSIVELQKELGDAVQVVCVTRYYGRGMEFGPGATTPHGGRTVEELDRAAELAVNRAFVAAFGLNYPVVLTKDNVGGERFGVTGIPTMVVLSRDGRLVGKVTGGGAAQHEQLRALIDKAQR